MKKKMVFLDIYSAILGVLKDSPKGLTSDELLQILYEGVENLTTAKLQEAIAVLLEQQQITVKELKTGFVYQLKQKTS